MIYSEHYMGTGSAGQLEALMVYYNGAWND
jgi:hypothetical protein